MCKSRLFLCSLAVLTLSWFGSPAYAQTRGTPAVEGECGVLKEDGVTPGLFGLCVAYCKGSAGASGRARVLENYNRRRKDTDPRMPCLYTSAPTPPPVPDPGPIAQPCPCWTAVQADAVDGILSDGSPAAGWSAKGGPDVCAAMPDFSFINESSFTLPERTFIRTANVTSQQDCQYLSMVGGVFVDKHLSVPDSLTEAQLAACTADVLARQAALGICR